MNRRFGAAWGACLGLALSACAPAGGVPPGVPASAASGAPGHGLSPAGQPASAALPGVAGAGGGAAAVAPGAAGPARPALDPAFPFHYRAQKLDGGGELRLGEFEGQPVLVHLWASWCRPCLTEMPRVAALHARYAPQGLRLLSVSIDSEVGALKRFLQHTPVPGVLLHDPANEASLTFGVDAIPASFLYNRRGQLVFASALPLRSDDPALHRALAAAVAP